MTDETPCLTAPRALPQEETTVSKYSLHLLVGMVAALSGWTLISVTNLGKDTAVLSVRIEAIEKQLTEIKREYFSQREGGALDSRIKDLEQGRGQR